MKQSFTSWWKSTSAKIENTRNPKAKPFQLPQPQADEMPTRQEMTTLLQRNNYIQLASHEQVYGGPRMHAGAKKLPLPPGVHKLGVTSE